MAKFTKVRVEPLVLGHYAPGHWQYADTTERPIDWPAPVGPVYKTKLEALADLESYAVRGGWLSRHG